MKNTKRIVAPKRICSSEASTDALFTPTDSQPFVAFLSHVTEGCSVKDLNPSCCVPLYLARSHSYNAVRRLKTIINGDGLTETAYDKGNARHESTLTGFVSGSPTSVVVPLVDDL